MTIIYDISVTTINAEPADLSLYRGRVMLIVNVASKCGFTGQYEGLEELYKTYAGRGFVVLGFPCDQFGHQEPGSEEEIKDFCRLNYGVSFPMFAKIEVNGKNAHPLYELLKKQRPGIAGSTAIKWNFTKFLVNREGQVVQRFAPATEPLAIKEQIESLL